MHESSGPRPAVLFLCSLSLVRSFSTIGRDWSAFAIQGSPEAEL